MANWSYTGWQFQSSPSHWIRYTSWVLIDMTLNQSKNGVRGLFCLKCYQCLNFTSWERASRISDHFLMLATHCQIHHQHWHSCLLWITSICIWLLLNFIDTLIWHMHLRLTCRMRPTVFLEHDASSALQLGSLRFCWRMLSHLLVTNHAWIRHDPTCLSSLHDHLYEI